MSGEAVDEVVVRPVRLVDHHDDVRALRQHRERMPASRSSLDRPNFCIVVNTIPPDCRPVSRSFKSAPRLGLHRRLGQGAPGLGRCEHLLEQLVVEVVAVGEHHQRRVVHRRIPHHLARVPQHLEGLARALRVPHHAAATISFRSRGGHSFVDSTAALTAQYWWYFAPIFTRPYASSENTTKLRTKSRNTSGREQPFDQHLELGPVLRRHVGRRWSSTAAKCSTRR